MSERELKFITAGSKHVAFSDVTAEQTGLIAGRLYRFSANGGMALVRWGASDAVTGDGGWDFAVPAGAYIDVRCPAGVSAFNVIEADAGSTATAALAVAAIDEGT